MVKMKIKRNLIFICGSLQHIWLFEPVINKLVDFNVFLLNVSFRENRFEMEDLANKLNINYLELPNRNANTIKDIFNEINPQIIITPHDKTPIANLIIDIANSMLIPSLMIQDGIYNFNYKNNNSPISSSKMAYFIKIPIMILNLLTNKKRLKEKYDSIIFELRYGNKGKSSIYGTGSTTKIAVFGKSTKDFLVSLGTDPNKIVITGNPKFDAISKLNENKFSQSQKNKSVILLTQPFVEIGFWKKEQRKKFINTIIHSLHDLNDVNLIIKLHPFENKEDYEEIFEEIPKNIKIFKNSSVHDLINKSDLAITVSSTTGLESISLCKPLIIINLFQNEMFPLYEDMDIINISKEEKILPTIKSLLFNEKRRNEEIKKNKKAMQNHIVADGKSAERIALLIHELVTKD